MEMQQSNPNSLKTLQLHLKELANKQGKVGWLGGKNYPDGTPVAMIAAQNEFGNPAKNIPPRPFVRPAIAENENQWKELAAQGANKTLEGKITAEDVMLALTQAAHNAVSKNIATLTSPALKPATLAARRRRGNSNTKPLTDTGLMDSTLALVVENV